ncbi:ABC transporter ATP-binding protein [Gulosibacter chungangensis]|uniref:ABC transporter ATP-binding protein n=1 Tax=Gulosibacter chungangensis TaxID=979746 RepID=A0A7J5BG51_9MICO|nr:ABC transporter ATP-binding protein [Gulosibacter chungangensis]KAB1645263.1 ABC transporter ATP-binding protein [Gulosibacter chungangensis]
MIRTMLQLLGRGRGRLITSHLIFSVIGLLFRAAGIVLLVPLVAALFSEDPASAWPWLGMLALATVIGWFVDAAVARRAYDLGFGLLDTGQRTVAERISSIRLGWFNAENTSTTRQAVAATGPDLVGVIIYLVTPLIGAVLLPVFIGIGLLPIAWQLGIVALIGVPLLLGAYFLSGKFSRNADRAAEVANVSLTERIIQFARTQQALRAARRVEHERSLTGAALDAQHGATMRLLLLQIPGQIIFGIVSQLMLILLAGMTVVLAVRGELTVPQAIALIVVIVRYLESFTMLAQLSPGVEATTGTLRRIREVLDAPMVSVGTETLSPAAAGSAPRIEFQGVRFAYSTAASSGQGHSAQESNARAAASAASSDSTVESARVLDNFNLTLEPGTTTAIVGPSGSGKSTILALLAGLHEPTAGRIYIDDVDLATLTPEARRELVSVVFQQPYLFDGSVRENILVGSPEAAADAVAGAATLARVDTLAARLPDGMDARVGEAGSSLSGGERQRVSIARALLKPAPVLLVDEATSALDTENEVAVSAALTDDPISRTRVIVAHRLSSIRNADRVVFIDRGQIIEDGTIEELFAAEGRFASFWNQQHAASAWQLAKSAHSNDRYSSDSQ